MTTADPVMLLSAFGTAISPGTGADHNADGVTNLAGRVVFLGGFGC